MCVILLTGSYSVNASDLITDTIIDCLCDYGPTKIVTGPHPGAEELVRSLYAPHANTVQLQVFSPEQKYGLHADEMMYMEMIRNATHIVVFDADASEMKQVLYWAERYGLKRIL